LGAEKVEQHAKEQENKPHIEVENTRATWKQKIKQENVTER
jgi:hypothetical protein